MAIQLVGFPTTLGLPRNERLHAPAALRKAGFLEALRLHGGPVQDLGDLALPVAEKTWPVAEQVRQTVLAARHQAEFWQQHHKPGDLMLTMGGDHSTSLGTIWALTAMGYDYDIVWIDAHGDFNIIDTTPSGNTHGMVLALACGLMPEFMPAVTSPAALHLWGIRDLDPGERQLLQREAVEVLTPEQVRHQWDRIVMRLKPNILLSFDMDSLEPDDAPGTMTPVPGGFHRYEALELVGHIARNRHILALDLVELHPDYDRQGLTVDLARSVAVTALTGRAERSGSAGQSAAAD